MTVSLVATASATAASGASIVVNKPAGTVENDVMLAWVNIDGIETINTPSGWTAGGTDADTTNRLSVFHKVAGAGEPANYTFDGWTDEAVVAAISTYRGVDVTSPVNASGSGFGSSATPTAPTITTTVDGCHVIAVAGADRADTAPFAPPGGYTEQSDLTAGGDASGSSGSHADIAQVTAGTTGTAEFTASLSDSWVAFHVALAPAPPPSGARAPTGFTRHKVQVMELDLDRCANTYGVLPCTASGAVGTECYNTRATCQDKVNFLRAVNTLKFATPGHGAPAGSGLRSYIRGVDRSPTEIDLERGLPRAGAVTVQLSDEAAADIGADPYAATRPAVAGGTYWTRLLARNPHYVGRFARLKTAYFTDGWDESEFTTELYIIERIDPPDSQGVVRVTIKDPVKLADRRDLPEATDGKLAAALVGDATGLAITLGTNEGGLYPAAGFVRIGNEVIEYDGNAGDVLTVASFDQRGAFGTDAATHKIGDGVQLCHVWQNTRAWQVLDDLFAAAGVPPANIDSAGFLAEDDTWMGADFAVTTCVSRPTRITSLIADLVVQLGGYTWWDAVAQLVKFEIIAPRLPDEAPLIELTEAGHIIEGSVKPERLDDLRITVAGIYYDPKSATADLAQAVTYLRGELFINADAESADEYGDRRTDITFSRWFTAANAFGIAAAVARRVGRYRDAPQRITVMLDVKDSQIRAGSLVDLSIAQVVDVDGQPAMVRAIVTRRKDEGGRISLRLRATNLGLRYAVWAPDATADYPASPEYAHWAPDTETFPDDSRAYLYF